MITSRTGFVERHDTADRDLEGGFERSSCGRSGPVRHETPAITTRFRRPRPPGHRFPRLVGCSRMSFRTIAVRPARLYAGASYALHLAHSPLRTSKSPSPLLTGRGVAILFQSDRSMFSEDEAGRARRPAGTFTPPSYAAAGMDPCVQFGPADRSHAGGEGIGRRQAGVGDQRSATDVFGFMGGIEERTAPVARSVTAPALPFRRPSRGESHLRSPSWCCSFRRRRRGCGSPTGSRTCRSAVRSWLGGPVGPQRRRAAAP